MYTEEPIKASKGSFLKKMKLTLLLLLFILIATCSTMDDNSIPRDQFSQVQISDFEVNMDRDYIRGKIQNNGKHDITSSIFEFALYSGSFEPAENTQQMRANSIREYLGEGSLDTSKLLLLQNFVVREPLKPDYSTEFYFELKMDYESTNFLYTYDIVQIKGR